MEKSCNTCKFEIDDWCMYWGGPIADDICLHYSMKDDVKWLVDLLHVEFERFRIELDMLKERVADLECMGRLI